MLTQFTWNQYILTAGATATLYYLVILLLFYREEARRLLASRKNRTDLQAIQPLPSQVSIMGPASTQAGPLLTEAADILVAPSHVLDSHPEDAVLQSLPEEIKSLLATAIEGKASKEDFLVLLRLAISKYAPLTEPLLQEAVRQYLLDESKGRLPFNLTPADLQPLWSDNESGQ